ncbi:MAG TPA: discoidin domain-containing protein [Bryobacteraceae bacterium]|nr:discoidin domain-containing protein [Bryobacteraceae bacterium]
MKAVSILFGAAFTIFTAWCLGMMLLRRLQIPLHRLEEGLLAMVLGSACLSELMFAIAVVHLARTWFFVLVGAATFAGALATGAFRTAAKGKLPALPWSAWLLYGAVFLAFGYFYLGQALAPEMSPDGSSYHLGTVLHYYRAHGFVRLTTNMYANLSQGLELLFLFAFAFGRHSSAALVHFAFLVTLPLLMICYGRRIGRPWVGVSGAIFFYAAPVVGMDGSVAYNDVAVAAILFSLFYLLEVWEKTQIAHVLIPIGILAGWSYAVKYTAALAVPYALGFVIWKLRRQHQPILRPVLLTSLFVALFVAPWMIKNAMWMANPVAPFANRLFPNPYVHVSMEEDYRKYQRIYGLTSNTQIPLDLTVRGYTLTGLFGPLFLLTPLMFIAARNRDGRRLLVPALLFALPYATNVGARFLIPPAPFISLALALSLSMFPWFPVALLIAIAAAHAVSCWPDVLGMYCNQYAWRIAEVSWPAALRIESQDSYLTRKFFPDYPMARAMDRLLPRGAKVFAFSESASAYTDHLIIGRYLGAYNEELADILWNPLFTDFQARVLDTFRFPSRKVRRTRLVETANMGPTRWNVTEIRLYQAGQELPRASDWRLTAHPNPWDVQLAFDASPVTRWRSWQGGEPGMYIEVDLGQTRPVDAVTVLTSWDSTTARMRVEIDDGSGRWTTVAQKPIESEVPVEVNLRKLASEEVKRRGVEYLLIRDDDLKARDYRQYATQWGLKLVVEIGSSHLYQIQ